MPPKFRHSILGDIEDKMSNRSEGMVPIRRVAAFLHSVVEIAAIKKVVSMELNTNIESIKLR